MNQKSAMEIEAETIFRKCWVEPPIRGEFNVKPIADAIQAERQRCEGLREAVKNARLLVPLAVPTSLIDLQGIQEIERGINEALLSPTSAVEAERIQIQEMDRCSVCNWPLAKSVEEGCVDGNCSMRPVPKKTQTQNPSLNPKHIIFNGRVYGLLEEGCYTMKNPVQVVEKTQEPSLPVSKEKIDECPQCGYETFKEPNHE